LLASVKAFSAFFALASADLDDFSALTLAVVAASKAFRKALSSASSDEMRALAVARASAVQKGGKETSSKDAKKDRHDKQIKEKKFTLGGLSSLQILDTLVAQGDKFPHQVLYRNST
jgi:hypothetical protein